MVTAVFVAYIKFIEKHSILQYIQLVGTIIHMSLKIPERYTRCVQVLRSPNLFKKTTHHRKLKMQSFLNVITL